MPSREITHACRKHTFIENSYGRGYRFVQEVSRNHVAGVRCSQAPQTTSETGSLFVGRTDLLQRLEATLERARAGRGRLCLLTGEPGIGKTRLAEALEAHALSNNHAVAWGRCQAAKRTPPLWPFAQVLRDLQAAGVIDRTDDIDSARNRSDAISMLGHASLSDAVGGSHGNIDQVIQNLFAAAKKRPLLIVIDDLQWADAASLRLLASLIGEIARWPMLVLACQRSGDSPVDADRELRRLYAHPNCERFPLERLSCADVDSYLSSVFGNFDSAHGSALRRAELGQHGGVGQVGRRPAASEMGQYINQLTISRARRGTASPFHADYQPGELAGLDVLRLLNEPTSASLVYDSVGTDAQPDKDAASPEIVMIYDLGGGTFNVSVLEVFGDVREVRSTTGNTQLGGDDFDELLYRRFADHLKRRLSFLCSGLHAIPFTAAARSKTFIHCPVAPPARFPAPRVRKLV